MRITIDLDDGAGRTIGASRQPYDLQMEPRMERDHSSDSSGMSRSSGEVQSFDAGAAPQRLGMTDQFAVAESNATQMARNGVTQSSDMQSNAINAGEAPQIPGAYPGAGTSGHDASPSSIGMTAGGEIRDAGMAPQLFSSQGADRAALRRDARETSSSMVIDAGGAPQEATTADLSELQHLVTMENVPTEPSDHPSHVDGGSSRKGRKRS
jgi:hypothetical protein